MKILSVHNRYQQAGGEDGSTAQERALLRTHGHEVFEYEEHNDRIDGMSKLHVACRTIWSIETYRNVRRLIRKKRPDIVHVQNFFPLISPSIFWACHKERVPVVLHLRNFRLLCPSAYLYFKGRIYEDNVGKLFPWRAVKDAVYRDSRLATLTIALMLFVHKLLGTWSKKVTAYIALTEFQKQKMIEGGLPEQKIWVKPNFLQTTEGGSQRTDFAARERKETQKNDFNDVSTSDSDLTCGKPYALFVGRLSAEKGCDVLIRAWQLCCEKWQKDAELEASPVSTLNGFNDLNATVPQLLIVGDGPDEKRLKKIAEGVSSIQFLGKKKSDEVLRRAQGALALVFPSVWYEGMPRTIIESFSVSTPVIASDIGSMREMITNHKTGLVFKAGDSTDLAGKFEWAFGHTKEMRMMGALAFKNFEMKYSAETNYQQLMTIYQCAGKW
jgi:glycosyltransferase involved in cell wall biosynthesis